MCFIEILLYNVLSRLPAEGQEASRGSRLHVGVLHQHQSRGGGGAHTQAAHPRRVERRHQRLHDVLPQQAARSHGTQDKTGAGLMGPRAAYLCRRARFINVKMMEIWASDGRNLKLIFVGDFDYK